MKCYKYGKGMDDGVEAMLPIDPKAALHVGDVVEVVKNINSQPEALIGMKGVIVEEITNNPDDPDFVDGANTFYKVQFDHAVHGFREWDFFETEELKKGQKNDKLQP